MDRKLLHQQIDSFLETLREQHAHMKEQDRVYQIEQDIMLAEIRKLYDCCRLLSKPGTETAVQEKPVAQAPAKPIVAAPSAPSKEAEPKPVAPETQAPAESPVAEASQKVEEPVLKNTFRESGIHISQSSADEAPIISPTQLEIPIAGEGKTFEPFSHKESGDEKKGKSLADTFREEPSLYDKISKGREDNSLVTRMQKKPIADLKAAIGINEKFIFINHLFGGDALEYTNSIDYLNKSTDLQPALSYIQDTIAPKYKWDKESPTVLEFLDLVERRFL